MAAAWSAAPRALDPAAADSRSREALWLAYTPPLTYARAEGQRGTRLVPGLARGLPRLSADGRTYRFRFRRGLRYSNGAPLRASDFPHTVRRLRAVGSAVPRAYGRVRRIVADDRTGAVTVELRRPDASFPYALASVSSGLVPGGTPLRLAASRPPPGIGPYWIVRTSPQGGFLMRRRRTVRIPGIPRGNVDEIDVRIVPSRLRQAAAVIDGRLDYMQDPPPADLLPVARTTYSARYQEHPTASSRWVFFRARRPPFDEDRVRRAVSFAIDGGKLRRVHADLFEPGCNLLPEQLPGYERVDPCPYGSRSAPADLERARSLVERANADGSRVLVWAAPGDEGLGRYYTGTLRKIGLRARLRLGGGQPPRRAQTGIARWDGDVAHPADVLRQLEGNDAALDVEIESLVRERRLGTVLDDWAAIDRGAVESSVAAPLGAPIRSTFVSERLDFENCTRFHPLYGNDYSSFCLR